MNTQSEEYKQELQKVRQELADATKRALTIAQQTKKGHVYIISNVGSFGEGIYKIGQTRRPDPQGSGSQIRLHRNDGRAHRSAADREARPGRQNHRQWG